MIKIYKIFLGALLLSLFWFLVPVIQVQAGECVARVELSISPNPAPYNQSVTFKVTVDLSRSVLEPPNTANAGYCLKNGQPVKKINAAAESNEFGFVQLGEITVQAGNTGPYNLSKSVIPSDKGFKEGARFDFTGVAYSEGRLLGRSITQILTLSKGAFGTYACVADDGKYACSPGAKPGCPDTIDPQTERNVCAGKVCAPLLDSSKCAQPATAGTHKACVNNACMIVQGGGPDTCTTSPDSCARGGGGGPTTQVFDLPNPIGINTFQELVNVIGTWIFNLAIPVAVIIIIYAGVLMLTSGGSPTQFKKGTEALKWAVIGLAVVLIGKGFVTLIQSILSLRSP